MYTYSSRSHHRCCCGRRRRGAHITITNTGAPGAGRVDDTGRHRTRAAAHRASRSMAARRRGSPSPGTSFTSNCCTNWSLMPGALRSASSNAFRSSSMASVRCASEDGSRDRKLLRCRRCSCGTERGRCQTPDPSNTALGRSEGTGSDSVRGAAHEPLNTAHGTDSVVSWHVKQ